MLRKHSNIKLSIQSFLSLMTWWLLWIYFTSSEGNQDTCKLHSSDVVILPASPQTTLKYVLSYFVQILSTLTYLIVTQHIWPFTPRFPVVSYLISYSCEEDILFTQSLNGLHTVYFFNGFLALYLNTWDGCLDCQLDTLEKEKPLLRNCLNQIGLLIEHCL